MIFGVVVVVIGVLLLLQNLGLITGAMWSFVWPCLIIAVGVNIMMKHQDREQRRENRKEKHERD